MLDCAVCAAAVGAVVLRTGVSVAVIGAVDEVPNGRHILGVGRGVLADERLVLLVHLLGGLGALVGGYGGNRPAASGGDTFEDRRGGRVEVVGPLRVLCALLLEEA